MKIYQNKYAIQAAVITFLYLSIGFTMLHFNLVIYGWLFFIILPMVIGITIGATPSKKHFLVGGMLALIAFALLLFAFGLEGIVCLLMAMPILLPTIFIPAVISYYYHKIRKKNRNLKTTLVPLLIFFTLAPIEHYYTKNGETISISSEMILPYSTSEVFNAIKSFDTLDGPKPFLMKLDLPIPQKCILEKEEVGALRTCYFEEGKIVQRVTAWKKNKLMKMDIIDYGLTGRDWLTFKKAAYLFETLNNGYCKITRISTYKSTLKPRIYWLPFEKMGIEQEHEYVFNNLKEKLVANHQ